MDALAVPRFSRHQVSGLHTLAHLFPLSKRCGVYILEFDNGERYVGQAVDVVRRFAQHRRVHRDIAYVEFCAAPRDELARLEVRMIHQQRSIGHTLRNIVHGYGPLGDSDLDPLIEPSKQHAWLVDASTDLTCGGERSCDDSQRLKHRSKYRALQEHRAFPLVAQILHLYVPACIPRPAETERTFWSVSAMPGKQDRGGGRLSTLSINKMETLFLVAGEDGGNRYFGGVVNLSWRRLQESAGDLSQLARANPSLHFRRPGYESGAQDIVGVGFVGLEGFFEVWDLPGALEASRALNLMLMRKGPTMQWRWHCYDLADWAFVNDGALEKMWAAAVAAS